jgi:hypothetical protein
LVRDARVLPDAATVARGWQVQVDRGMRVDLPDGSLVDASRTACAAALLAATSRVPDEHAVAALEDWGFDVEVAASWPRLSARQRRRAARRSPTAATWADVGDVRGDGAASLLLAVRSFLVHEADAVITLLADLPEEWRGGSIEVHGAPTRRGRVSYAVRWHGERAALLWDGPEGVTTRAPGLDADWSTTEPSGEALLA